VLQSERPDVQADCDRSGTPARQLTRAAAGPFPDSALELNGTDIVTESDVPPAMLGVVADPAPMVPCAVLTTTRQVARLASAESLATTKLTAATGSVVARCCSANGTVVWIEVTENDGRGEPTVTMAIQVPIEPVTTANAVTSATARTTRERR